MSKAVIGVPGIFIYFLVVGIVMANVFSRFEKRW